jgi:hypothetical protein
VREAHSIQAISAFAFNLSYAVDSRLLFQYLTLTIQQKPNAAIDRAGRIVEQHPS